MYKLKKGKAYQHGNYIRPNYTSVWFEAYWQASEMGVSLSEFISHALYVFMTGREPVHWTGNFTRAGKLFTKVENEYAKSKGLAKIRRNLQIQRARTRAEEANQNVSRVS
jgi:hypothetical protein